jgi:hypothetical protein
MGNGGEVGLFIAIPASKPPPQVWEATEMPKENTYAHFIEMRR